MGASPCTQVVQLAYICLPLPLRRQLLASARVLSDFATAAARGADTDYLPAALVTHILASVKAIASCALLAGTLEQLDPQAAFAVCAPCSLVFGTGRAMLAPMVLSQSPQAAFHLCELQLAAAAVAVGDLLLPSRQPRAAAAFANSTAKPQALVAWLGELCRALLNLQDDIEPGQCNERAPLGACITIAAFDAAAGVFGRL